MNREEAKALLQCYRPGGQDATDPQFAEALALAGRDPALGLWFARQRAFDAVVASGLGAVPAPADLKQTILADSRIVRAPYWQRPRVRLAAAAAVLLLFAAAGFFLARSPRNFATFRQDIVEASWEGARHLDFAASDVASVKQWLQQQQAAADFTLPRALQTAQVQGCRVIEWEGRKVSFVCLLDGLKHYHLFVAEGLQLGGAPQPNHPQFEQCAGWKTASWATGGKTYVLAGMKLTTFVKKFRKLGQWDFAG
jgi:hypothetical protein